MQSEEAWVEAFEDAVGQDEAAAYLQISRELMGRPDATEAEMAANPLILVDYVATVSLPRLDILLRVTTLTKTKM